VSISTSAANIKKKDNRKHNTLTGKADVDGFSCDRPYLIRYIKTIFPHTIIQRIQQTSEHKGCETIEKQGFVLY